MTWVVPLSLGGLAIAVMALFTMLGARKARHAQATAAAAGPRILVHDINDDRCTGCDACVAVCPTNVLDLVNNKSRVLRFHDCIQCEACMWACPTEALVMFPEGSEPQPLKVPELDDAYQTGVRGQYLIGEVAGKPLVKNAANVGRGVIEHMLRTGLRPGALAGNGVDVAIVGSGPGGLSAALTCIQRGLSYVVLEKEQQIASTITRYPKGKLVMAEPYDTRNLSLLPVFDSSKEQLVAIWRELIERTGLRINQGEAVESVQQLGDGSFDVRTTVAAYRAQRVILATGTRGKPRTLQVPGENLPKVANLLEDPDEWRGKDVLVVGGGDSAVEAAVALADAGARVIISYRGKSFNRAAPKNKQTIEAYAAQQRLKAKYGSQVVAFEPEAVILQLDDGSQKRYPNHGAFVLIGADPPVTWLEKLGVRFVLRPHQYSLGKTDDFLRRLLGELPDCPEDAARAAQAVTGRAQAPSAPSADRLPSEVERALAAVSMPDGGTQTGAKKWLRAATGLFSTGKKVEQPIPLSEFAKRQRTGASGGGGRRDALSAGERTRVLRMLRDEGGRLADEESRVSYVDFSAIRSAPPSRDDTPPPRPAPRPSAPPPVAQDDIVAKPAVIVGLAKATAAGPRTRSGKADEIELGPGVRMKPGRASRPPPEPIVEPPAPEAVGPGAIAPMFLDAKTQLPEVQARGPARARPPERPATPPERPGHGHERPLPGQSRPAGGRSLRRAPAGPPSDFGADIPTRAAEVDPRILAASAHDPLEDTGSLEDPTRLGSGPFAADHDRTSADFDIRAAMDDARRVRDPDFDDDGEDVLSATLGHGATGAIDLGPRDQSRRYPRLDADEPTRTIDTRPPRRR